MNFNDEFFNKVERKTKVNKKTILDLAEKLNNGNMKNENTIREVITTLSKMTGKNISKEKERSTNYLLPYIPFHNHNSYTLLYPFL